MTYLIALLFTLIVLAAIFVGMSIGVAAGYARSTKEFMDKSPAKIRMCELCGEPAQGLRIGVGVNVGEMVWLCGECFSEDVILQFGVDDESE